MQAALAPRGDARTYLIHFVGGGLDDERYVVENYRRSLAATSFPSRPTVLAPRAGARRARGSCR